jgi:nitroreductase
MKVKYLIITLLVAVFAVSCGGQKKDAKKDCCAKDKKECCAKHDSCSDKKACCAKDKKECCAKHDSCSDKKVCCKGKNAVVGAIMSRRSIRSYKPEQIKDEELNLILEAGINAPSAMNRQSWEIRVVQTPEILSRFDSMTYKAPTVIVIAGNATLFSPIDCGLLGENILLAAESLGIGTCVIGGIVRFFDTPAGVETIKKLDLPEGYKPLYAIATGYKNEAPAAKPRDKGKIKFIK